MTMMRLKRHDLTGEGAVFATSGAIAVMFMGSTLVTPLYVLYQRDFGFSELTLTLVYAAYVIGNLGALLFFGRLSDLIGRRRTTLPAMAAAVVSTALFLAADSTPWLVGGRIVSGFAIGIASSTCTAWLAELYPGADKSRASLVASGANFIGLAAGALTAGLLAQYAAKPLELPYFVYLAAVFAVAVMVWRTRETVERPVRSVREVSLRPRIGVPASIRAQFVAPAAAAFGTFAFIGFYAALVPSVLIDSLHETNHAVGGVMLFELCAVAVIAMIATRRLTSRAAMLCGLALLLHSSAMLVTAQFFASMPTLVIGTALGGIAVALGYRGSLQVVNQIAPTHQRAEVISSYLIVCYFSNALPVIGVGVISRVSGSMIASVAFGCTVAAFALLALITGAKYTPRSRPV
jgi:hypothetical protein